MSTLLSDLTSRDPHRIWSATSAVTTLRDPVQLDLLAAQLPEIRAQTAGIDLGGALLPNSERLKFVLHKLEYWRDRTGCLCRLYPDWLQFDPNREAKAGNIRILETNLYERTYTCECALCGTRYTVEEGEYHYTWWKWQPVD